MNEIDVKVKIKFDGKEIELPIKALKKLYEELSNLFEKRIVNVSPFINNIPPSNDAPIITCDENTSSTPLHIREGK